MRKLLVSVAAGCVFAGAALAGESPLYGPAPDWVKPFEGPSEPETQSDAATDVIYVDKQFQLEPGRRHEFAATAIKINSPQGLAVGNISLAWRPETDDITIHKLQINRGDEIIDVLASGQTFTVMRREANLEISMLDGVLTANIQPDGLQVGDVVEMAMSLTSADPTLEGHTELIVSDWAGMPIRRQRLRVEWPASAPMKISRTVSMPQPKVKRAGDRSFFELVGENLSPNTPPKGAPMRFQLGPMLEMTDFESWSELGALIAPLYAKAAAVPADGPLRAEVERIKAASTDPVARAEAALHLVQDKVRYVALMMGDGGLVPANAETTWSRRYGDCKGKTALLLAVLHDMGIDAEPVVVSSIFGDGLDARLPQIGLFDHVLVRATIGGRDYWLDGTRTGDGDLANIQTPAFGWGLPLIAQGAALVRMMPAPLETPSDVLTVEIDAREGLSLPAPAKVEMILRGDAATVANLALVNLTPDLRDRTFREAWRREFDVIEVKSTTTSFDAQTGELRISLEGTARLDWSNGRYKPQGFGVGFKADFERGEGPQSEAPFSVGHPFYRKRAETVLLPPGFPDQPLVSESDVDETVAGVEYRRRATLTAGVYTIEKSERSLLPEFPAQDAGAAQAALRALSNLAPIVKLPEGYFPTDAEVSNSMASTPTTAAGFNQRGLMLLDRGRFDEAIADFDRAMAIDKQNVYAFANRAVARVWKGEYEQAKADIDAAIAIDPRNAVAFRARGFSAQRQGDFQAAEADYTTSLKSEPGNGFSLARRAETRRSLGDDDGALEDAAAALKIEPKWIDLHLLRANVFRRRGDHDGAIAEAVAAAKADPVNTYGHIVAANIYGALGKRDEAMAEFDRAIAVKSDPAIYLNRAFARPKANVAGRQADIDSALKLDPKSDAALGARAQTQAEAGDLKGAIATLGEAIELAPEHAGYLSDRGVLFARLGDDKRAEKDFSIARKYDATAQGLNDLCWKKATAGVALASALADCNEALGKDGYNAAILDSRAFIYLRLERYKDAIADYNRALSLRPEQAASLYGRAVAFARLGQKAEADADMAAAILAHPAVKEEFEGYGLTP